MKLLQKILLATDFNPAAEDACKMAIQLAKYFGSEIYLLSVIPTPVRKPMTLVKMKEAAKQKIKIIKKNMEKEGLHVVDMISSYDAPFERIIQVAEDHDVNAIIMGSGEKNAKETFQLGITAERVIRKSQKPVWIVKKDCPVVINKILCPMDFSEPSSRALQNAIHLARSFKASLQIISVIAKTKKSQSDTKDLEQKKLDKYLKSYDFHQVTWSSQVILGEAYREILSLARQGIDLIVMGSVGKTGLAKITLGKVAEKVIREMPSSIIMMKSEHAIRLDLEEELDNIESLFKQGKDLLEKGFIQEAMQKFHYILSIEKMFTPALEGLAAAHTRLGHDDMAKDYLNQVKLIQTKLWKKQVEFEMRRSFLRKMK